MNENYANHYAFWITDGGDSTVVYYAGTDGVPDDSCSYDDLCAKIEIKGRIANDLMDDEIADQLVDGHFRWHHGEYMIFNVYYKLMASRQDAIDMKECVEVVDDQQMMVENEQATMFRLKVENRWIVSDA